MDNTSQPDAGSSLTTAQKIMKFMGSNMYGLIGVFLFTCILGYLIYRMNSVHVKNTLKYGSQAPGQSEESNANIVEIMYFYTDWCPHCKNALPEWDQFKDIYQGKTIKNMKIKCLEINCDEDEETANKYNVEAYPTIKLVKDDTVYEYDAKPNVDTLGQFLKSVL